MISHVYSLTVIVTPKIHFCDATEGEEMQICVMKYK